MTFDIVSPLNTAELLKSIKDLQGKNFRFGAGYTDLLMEFRHNEPQDMTVINLALLEDSSFTGIHQRADTIEIGALAKVAALTDSPVIKQQFPVLHQAALSLASMQIREMATVGGNICTASPAGDVACALVALSADCTLIDSDGHSRLVPITKFFTGVRKTSLQKNEILKSVIISKNELNTKSHSGFIKIGTRLSMECSVVSLAYHIQLSELSEVIHAGLAIGSAAPTIQDTSKAAEYLLGKNINKLTDLQINEFAKLVLSYAKPIDDIRASAWYRTEVLTNISKSIVGG